MDQWLGKSLCLRGSCGVCARRPHAHRQGSSVIAGSCRRLRRALDCKNNEVANYGGISRGRAPDVEISVAMYRSCHELTAASSAPATTSQSLKRRRGDLCAFSLQIHLATMRGDRSSRASRRRIYKVRCGGRRVRSRAGRVCSLGSNNAAARICVRRCRTRSRHTPSR
jgi:hypothetical protein